MCPECATRYIWSYIFGTVCPERAEAAALIMPHADTQAMSAHLAEIAKTVASGAHALLILDGALAGTVRQSWRYPTTSPCSNSRPIPLNSTRWKMCGLICVPTSSPYPSSTIMSRSSTGVAKHGTSLQTTKPQSRQSLPDNGPKRSTTRAVGITPSRRTPLSARIPGRASCPIVSYFGKPDCGSESKGLEG